MQWNVHGYSRFILFEPDANAGFQLVKEKGDVQVYTYQIKNCSIETFVGAKRVPIENALFEKVTLDDLTGVLEKGTEDGLEVYSKDSCKIYVEDNIVVITNYKVSASEVMDTLENN